MSDRTPSTYRLARMLDQMPACAGPLAAKRPPSRHIAVSLDGAHPTLTQEADHG